jgi:hypothetical protein
VCDNSHTSDPGDKDNIALHSLLLASCMCSSAGRVDVFCKPRYIIGTLSCVIWVLMLSTRHLFLIEAYVYYLV